MDEHVDLLRLASPDPCGERTLDALAAKATAVHADMLQLAEHMLAALDGLARGYALLLTRMDRQEARMRAIEAQHGELPPPTCGGGLPLWAQ